MINNLNLDKNKKYLVGVSGGSDSMGLLAMLYEQKYNIVVCAVNYKLRANADKEEDIVKQYCFNRNIPVYSDYPKQTVKENFQKWARDVRYDFYYQILVKEKCDVLLLAHQKDDHLENYLMALQRNSHGWFYGISEKSYHHNMTIIRPLLCYRKEEIRQYCLSNDVPFSDDESNFSDKYARNRIRHHIIQIADDKQIEQWCLEIEDFNNHQQTILNQLEAKYADGFYQLADYRQQDKEYRYLLLRYLLYKRCPNESYSCDFITEMDRQIICSKKNFNIDVADNVVLVCEYNKIYLSLKKADYTYQLDKLEYLNNDEFTLSNTGRIIEGLMVKESDFPLTIRNYQSSDSIQLRFGNKKVNRILIDKKVAYQDRIKWLVIVNKQQKVIFVENVGCDVDHYSTNMNLFVLKS